MSRLARTRGIKSKLSAPAPSRPPVIAIRGRNRGMRITHYHASLKLSRTSVNLSRMSREDALYVSCESKTEKIGAASNF